MNANRGDQKDMCDAKPDLTMGGTEMSHPRLSDRWDVPASPADRSADDARAFDADAWIALVEEQRRIIARAAGVDPAKVRIHVGH